MHASSTPREQDGEVNPPASSLLLVDRPNEQMQTMELAQANFSHSTTAVAAQATTIAGAAAPAVVHVNLSEAGLAGTPNEVPASSTPPDERVNCVFYMRTGTCAYVSLPC